MSHATDDARQSSEPNPTEPVDSLAREAWDGYLAAHPLTATQIGERRFDDRLSDISPEGDAIERRRLAALLARAGATATDGLRPADLVTRSALIGWLAMELDLLESETGRWTVDPLEGPQVEFLNIESFQTVDKPADGERMIRRWLAMGPWIDRHAANILDALADGRVSPAAPMRAVIDELNDLLATPLEASPLLVPARLERPGWSPFERTAFQRGLAAAVGDVVRPAFERYRAVLAERVLPAARSDDRPGLEAVAGGSEAYRRLVRAHTSLELTPGEIHAIGLAEVARIDAELEMVAGKALGAMDHASALERLRSDPRLYFESPDEVAATARNGLARATAAIADWFGILPQADCEVVEMGGHEAKHSTIAYYRPPAVGGNRPGRYYINTTDPETRPRYEAEALAFHEAVPGHHLQIAIAQELDGLPDFQRHAGPTAFIEGWGLYSERLSDEMGLYSSDLARIGIASYDGWRACRLVVDTGIHALGWSRDAAIQFMLEHTALARNNIVNEVDRYITWPGQALAYKLGQLEIRKLRAEAEAALARRFRAAAFHDAVLGNGAVPLATLREITERYVEKARS